MPLFLLPPRSECAHLGTRTPGTSAQTLTSLGGKWGTSPKKRLVVLDDFKLGKNVMWLLGQCSHSFRDHNEAITGAQIRGTFPPPALDEAAG